MALKFLNKKGWHTGSLRNIENVWKAEQKHDAEQRKLDELRKQIQEERERSEFRLLQEQAGLVPRQERLEFLYDSGLAVGKGASSSGGGSGIAFQALEEDNPTDNKSNDASSASAAAKQASAPGALFEHKPHSANDSWRKLHSDPLLLIRQREQEALARIKNNPIQMALIRKSAEAKKDGKSDRKKEHQKKKSRDKAKHRKRSSSEEQSDSVNVHFEREKRRDDDDIRRRSKHDDHYHKAQVGFDENSRERESRRKNSYRGSNNRDLSPHGFLDLKAEKNYGKDTIGKNYDKLKSTLYSSEDQIGSRRDRGAREHGSSNRREKESRGINEARSHDSSVADHHDSHYKHHRVAPKLSEEERAARLREMQADAELHEEQRWKRLRKADEDDSQEAKHASIPGGRNFLDAAHRSVYGTERGGSSTIEESVRRRTHYSQGKSEARDGNAFRR